MTAVEILYQMETDILANMIRLLKRGAIGSAQWQAEKLAQLGTLRSMNERTIKKSLMRAVEEAQKEILDRGTTAARGVDAVAGNLARELPSGADARLKAVLDGWYLRNATELNRMGATMFNSANNLYTRTVETVTAEVLAGVKTGRQAIRDTAGAWYKDGIKAFTDKAGRQWSTEAYAQNIIRTTTSNARREATFARMDEYGMDLIEISSHAGARPLCATYQGMVISRKGLTPGYTTLDETSYGEPAGLFGINCGHMAYAYQPGQKKTFKPYPDKENEKVYKESQEQRRLEREIRQEKRGLQISKELGDEKEAVMFKERISEKQANMRSFIDESGRTRRYDREQVY